MSAELAKEARAKMRQKAHNMASGDPHAKVDASSWTPSEPLNTDWPTGELPVSPRAYKRGGKVEGASEKRADRKPRKGGGRALTPNNLINRDVKEANEERDGVKHVGGYKRGGHVDAKEDKALVRSMVDKSALKKETGGSVSDGTLQGTRPTGGRLARKQGGSAHWIKGAIKHPGALHKELHVPKGEKIPEKKLMKAEHSSNKMEAKRAHLAETLKEMRPERASGGRAGKMNVNIVIAGKPSNDSTDQGLQAPIRPPPMPVAPPPMAAPPMVPPGAGGPPMPMPMARKTGGRALMEEAGAGSGLGRLQKIKDYGKNA